VAQRSRFVDGSIPPPYIAAQFSDWRWFIGWNIRSRSNNPSGVSRPSLARSQRRIFSINSVAALLVVFLAHSSALAQYQAPSDRLILTAKTATTWTDADTDILQLEGPVKIELENATLSAEQAVAWLSPEKGAEQGRRKAQFVLLGSARVKQGDTIRSGDRMVVNASVAGRIRLIADDRIDRDQHDSYLYRLADSTRDPSKAAPTPATEPATLPSTTAPSTGPTTVPATGPTLAATPGATTQPVKAPVMFEAESMEMVETDDGTVAAILAGGVKLLERRPNGDLLEMQGQRVVLFTPLKNLRELQQRGGVREIQDAVTAAYIEGDVRVVFTPNTTGPQQHPQKFGEQRLEGSRVYYDFTTDRAILTDAVMHTVDPKGQLPIIVHAKTMRQLSRGEFETGKAELSTSAFAVPTYSIRASKIYIRQNAPTENDAGSTHFEAQNTSFRTFGVPFFWLPGVSGDYGGGQIPLRSIGLEHSTQFGTGFTSQWGLFETLGMKAPRDLDAAYRADYFSDRGPAGGLNLRYQGGSVTETSHQPWSFEGEFRSYFVYDHGTDDIGRPVPVHPDDEYRLRGAAEYEHTHFFPDGWQAQIRAGWVSDQNFLEQWLWREYDRGLPHDVSLYLKHQKENEAFSLLIQFQPNSLITSSDYVQEQFEVEHLPQIDYHLIGQNAFNDKATFYSDNSVAGLHYQKTRASLSDQGFFPPYINPGLPSLGYTGLTNDTVWRGDFRQEIAFPFSAGQFRVVPYLMGRYTMYSDSPADGTIHRLFGGLGARVTTAFWKVDDTVESELFDIHRMRHVIEPELNVFTSATTKDRNSVFIFDENVDPVNDVSAVQLALHQRWQTYRGGPGHWRSVDFFTLNLEANLFSNQPDELGIRPEDFRGLFFASEPELSVPRNSINGDFTWRIADTTALLGDAQWNIDKRRLATASVGLVAQRDERSSYYVGTRYIDDLNSVITTFAVDYQINSKYNVSFSQSFDFGVGENVASSLAFIRKFDTVFIVIRATHNETLDQNSFGINIIPRGFRAGLDTDTLNNALETRRR
jgi:lipopolysaccharide assembly outer membrane protein LptD (OstA)